ncbi:prevent-host-death protein [Streptomyces sp. 150FB]|uniref:type II toxin-antitoxin system Phd/YefM family antitoxin n=1 Tax=Streptomyces sp. 150FB TaxID=1576605 RepID=UPI00058957CF|nr:type II toxin-antitoxin system prevent-host-death family antitoxin [Streptomyces sp. 150FB]KIF79211.1 prevent-host-death protein [Streptomyces sp. 150FB]
MERVPVRELNQNTSAVLARVRQGESLEVTVSGSAVARLLPISGPIPLPPVLGDPSVDTAQGLSTLREEERC